MARDSVVRGQGRTHAEMLPEIQAANRAWQDEYRPLLNARDERLRREREEARAILTEALKDLPEEKRALVMRYTSL